MEGEREDPLPAFLHADFELPPLYHPGPVEGHLEPPHLNFRFDMLPFIGNEHEQNEAHVEVINRLRDRTLDALYDRHDKTEQAYEVAEAHFDTMMELPRHEEEIGTLFCDTFESNLFGDALSGINFFKKMRDYPSVWTIFDAGYINEDTVAGRVACSMSDQMITYSVRWHFVKRHFVFTCLDRIIDGSAYPRPIYGVDLPQRQDQGN